MLTSQKISLRTSEIRLRLNELQEKDPHTDEEQAEMRRLSREFTDCQTRESAAIIVESKESENRGLEFSTDGQGTEYRALVDRAQYRQLFDGGTFGQRHKRR